LKITVALSSEINVVMHCLERVLFLCCVCVNFISLRIVFCMYSQCLFVITLVNKDYRNNYRFGVGSMSKTRPDLLLF